MLKYPVCFLALFAIIDNLVAEKAMAAVWGAARTCEVLVLRNDKGEVIGDPNQPVMLAKNSRVDVLNNCENDLCRLGAPFRSDPNDKTFLDVYVRRVITKQDGKKLTLITHAGQDCFAINYYASDPSQN
jgi:hypothetical protein